MSVCVCVCARALSLLYLTTIGRPLGPRLAIAWDSGFRPSLGSALCDIPEFSHGFKPSDPLQDDGRLEEWTNELGEYSQYCEQWKVHEFASGSGPCLLTGIAHCGSGRQGTVVVVEQGAQPLSLKW